MVKVIEELRANTKMFAIFAPAAQGQFDEATLPQIKQAIRELGFEEAYEAAIGADAVAWYEREDALVHKSNGAKITTSAFAGHSFQHIALEASHFH